MKFSDIPAALDGISTELEKAKVTPYLGRDWRPVPGERHDQAYARYCNFVCECPDTRLSFYYWRILVRARLRDEGKS